MPEDFLNPESSSSFRDRRKTARAILKSVVYAELEPGNGGLVLNLCEDGIAIQAAEPIIGADFPHLRFCFPNSTKWIEVEGKLVWEDASRKESGIHFIRISADARAQIRSYLNGAKASLEVGRDAGSPAHSPDVAEHEPHSLEVAQELGLSAELDSMFPSEKGIGSSRAAVVHRGADFFPSEAAAHARSSRNRVPLEPIVGTLESDVAAEVGRPNQSDLHRYGAPAHPRPVVGPAVGVDRAHVGSSHTRLNPEASSSEQNSGMAVPNFRHCPPNPSPNSSLNSSTDPKGDGATYERLVAAFAAAANSSSAHSDTSSQARVSNASDHRPSDHPPIAFSGFGYQPSEFEEPFGKKWIGVAAVLVALMAIGVVLAVGPANVKDIISRRHAIFESLAGPPPPTLPEKQSDKPDAAADATANQKPAQPAASSAAPTAALPSDTLDVQGSQNASPSTADPAPSIDTPTPPSAKDPDEQYGGADTADPEAEVLQFQREHSEAGSSYHTPPDASVPYPKPSVPPAAVPPAASIAEPPRGRSIDQPLSEPPRSTPQTQQPRDGVVAIRSSFNAVRGIDAQPSQTSDPSSNEGPVVPGPLQTMRQPNYPEEALRAHVEGTVTLRATVNRTGGVQAVQLIGGPPILVPAAIEAVRQWRYAPTTLNGQAVECTEDISVVFRMANSVAASH